MNSQPRVFGVWSAPLAFGGTRAAYATERVPLATAMIR